MPSFKLESSLVPSGDQPQAVAKMVESIRKGNKYQSLLGVTGSGKTFTMANIIAALNRPTLIISHNKTLAAQLYTEFKGFFPANGVGYFVSYYDYYQPESYVPKSDLFIEKDASINEHIDKLRLAATSNLLSRRDSLIVSSVSCIYGLGSPEEYQKVLIKLEVGSRIDRKELLERLIHNRYERNDIDFKRGVFRVKGDTIDIYPSYAENAFRIEIDFDCIRRLREIDVLTGKTINEWEHLVVYPAKHFLTSEEAIQSALASIKAELAEQIKVFKSQDKYLEAQRLESRTHYDMEMLEQLGYCTGIENYSRHLSGRRPGSRPACLLDYFPEDYLIIIDESHVTLPQIRGMYAGDRSRKETLVEYGFRLPSALDNRPLNIDEFKSMINQVLFVSATPGDYERSVSTVIAEQIIRPTGLLDPVIEVRPTDNQIDDLIDEVKKRADAGERTLVTTLTKRMSEDLTGYLADIGIRVKYLHSEIDALERVEILKNLRRQEFDCLIGVNLLREGLDLPEVSLVAVLDADKEGFLRSQTSLIQVAGRAARHINGYVIMYADTITDSMKKAITETNRRRKIQLGYNNKNQITPTSISKAIEDGIEVYRQAEKIICETAGFDGEDYAVEQTIEETEMLMFEAAKNLEFEKAAKLRDQLNVLRGGGKKSGKKMHTKRKRKHAK